MRLQNYQNIVTFNLRKEAFCLFLLYIDIKILNQRQLFTIIVVIYIVQVLLLKKLTINLLYYEAPVRKDIHTITAKITNNADYLHIDYCSYVMNKTNLQKGNAL